jgi:hypothetical protein
MLLHSFPLRLVATLGASTLTLLLVPHSGTAQRSTRYVVAVAYPRPLTGEEKAIALRVLEMAGAPEIDKLRRQVEIAVATRPCSCPCPSVELAVDHERAEPIAHGGRFDAEMYYDAGAVMVWVDDGWLSNLETWWWSDDPPREFPPPEVLRPTPP